MASDSEPIDNRVSDSEEGYFTIDEDDEED